MGLPDLLTSGLLLPLQGGEAVRLSETKEETVEARDQVGNLHLVEALTLWRFYPISFILFFTLPRQYKTLNCNVHKRTLGRF